MTTSKATAKPARVARTGNAEVAKQAAGSAVVQPQSTARRNNYFEGLQVYRFDPQARIALIRHGIPASTITKLSSRMGMTNDNLLSSLGLSRASIGRKVRGDIVLSSDESERVLGMENLIDMVQAMVEESGDPTDFDAARWLSDWLTKPLPALAGATPASYLDTFEGPKLVAELLSMTQSGAYA